MKLIIILSVCVMACAAEYYTLSKDDYTAKKIKSDITEINKRLDCYLERQPCASVPAEHKRIGEEAVRTACAKCPPELKEIGRAFLEIIREKFPEDYRQMRAKYDPSGQYFSKFEEALGVSQITPETFV